MVRAAAGALRGRSKPAVWREAVELVMGVKGF